MDKNRFPHSPWSRFALLIVAVAALALTLGACSSSGSSKSSGATAAITVKDFAFTSTPVKAGATVTVHNNGPSTHTVTADDGKSFDKSVDPGKDVTFTAPAKAGTYKFHCNIHTQMHGTLVVQ
jgi:plastocyanin